MLFLLQIFLKSRFLKDLDTKKQVVFDTTTLFQEVTVWNPFFISFLGFYPFYILFIFLGFLAIFVLTEKCIRGNSTFLHFFYCVSLCFFLLIKFPILKQALFYG